MNKIYDHANIMSYILIAGRIDAENNIPDLSYWYPHSDSSRSAAAKPTPNQSSKPQAHTVD